jgi:hypothetical protein
MGRPIKPKPINPTEGFTDPPLSAMLCRSEQIHADQTYLISDGLNDGRPCDRARLARDCRERERAQKRARRARCAMPLRILKPEAKRSRRREMKTKPGGRSQVYWWRRASPTKRSKRQRVPPRLRSYGSRQLLAAAFGNAGTPDRQKTRQQGPQGPYFRNAGTFDWPLFTSRKSTQRYRNRLCRKSAESRRQREFDAVAHGVDTLSADAHAIAEAPDARMPAPAADNGMVAFAV